MGEKVKKPFYKKWWVWVLVIVFIAAMGSSSEEPELVGSNGDATEESGSNETESNEPTIFNVGDTVELKDFRVTVNGVRTSEGKDFMTPEEGNEFFLVDATIENISETDQTVSSMLMFSIVDQDGRTYDQSIMADTNGQLDGTVGPTRKITGEYAVEVPVGTTGLELQFDSVFSSKQIVFKLN